MTGIISEIFADLADHLMPLRDTVSYTNVSEDCYQELLKFSEDLLKSSTSKVTKYSGEVDSSEILTTYYEIDNRKYFEALLPLLTVVYQKFPYKTQVFLDKAIKEIRQDSREDQV